MNSIQVDKPKIEYKLRSCLRCEGLFTSNGIQNRVCKACRLSNDNIYELEESPIHFKRIGSTTKFGQV